MLRVGECQHYCAYHHSHFWRQRWHIMQPVLPWRLPREERGGWPSVLGDVRGGELK